MVWRPPGVTLGSLSSAAENSRADRDGCYLTPLRADGTPPFWTAAQRLPRYPDVDPIVSDRSSPSLVEDTYARSTAGCLKSQRPPSSALISTWPDQLPFCWPVLGAGGCPVVPCCHISDGLRRLYRECVKLWTTRSGMLSLVLGVLWGSLAVAQSWCTRCRHRADPSRTVSAGINSENAGTGLGDTFRGWLPRENGIRCRGGGGEERSPLGQWKLGDRVVFVLQGSAERFASL
jgi:hypothetical protein